jgi:hypothetical protein
VKFAIGGLHVSLLGDGEFRANGCSKSSALRAEIEIVPVFRTFRPICIKFGTGGLLKIRGVTVSFVKIYWVKSALYFRAEVSSCPHFTSGRK